MRPLWPVGRLCTVRPSSAASAFDGARWPTKHTSQTSAHAASGAVVAAELWMLDGSVCGHPASQVYEPSRSWMRAVMLGMS